MTMRNGGAQLPAIGSLVIRRGGGPGGASRALGIVTRCEPRSSSREWGTVCVWVFSGAHETWTGAWAFDAWWETLS